MKIKWFAIILMIGYYFTGVTIPNNIPSDLFEKFVNIRGPYLGQKLPGVIPQEFAPFLIDYKKHHIHSAPAFSPDGKEFFFLYMLILKNPSAFFILKWKQMEDG